MMKDITIGQYFPGESVVHKLDPRTKIILAVAFLIMLFATHNFAGLILGIVFVLFAYLIAGIPLLLMLKSLKAVLVIVLFTAIINMLFVTGNPLFVLGPITISDQGVYNAIFFSCRIVCLIAGTSLLTYTTSPILLTDGIEKLFSPLKKIGLPVHELAMMMTIALRFIPSLIEETDKIMSAQKARGADLESGNIVQRAKALIPILIPLFVSAFRRADELALTMECRCYHGDEGRTRMRQLKIKKKDIASLVLMALLLAVIVYMNHVFPKVI